MAYAFIRIFLGAALFMRGWFLFSDPAALTELARAEQQYWYFAYITISVSSRSEAVLCAEWGMVGLYPPVEIHVLRFTKIRL